MLDNVSLINGIRNYQVSSKTPKTGTQAIAVVSSPNFTGKSMSTQMYLAQMPKVSFKGDDLSAYSNYRGEQPPAIEQHKYRLSLIASNAQDEGNLEKAALTKLDLADICRNQGKADDAFYLETSAHEFAVKLAEKGEKSATRTILERMAKAQRAIGDERAAYLLETTLYRLLH